MRIGVLGGTFDPPHLAHLNVADAAMKQLELDEVLFIPANQNPQKTRRRISSPKDRLEMTRLATKGHPGFSVSDIELTRGGPSYSFETLMELEQIRPAQYWLIMGSDALMDFHTWRQPDKILKLSRLAVVLRPGTDIDKLRRYVAPETMARVDLLSSHLSSVSSTEIRDHVERGKNPSRWLPDAVWQYIIKQRLYQDESTRRTSV